MSAPVLRVILSNTQKGLSLVAVDPRGYEVRSFSGVRLISAIPFQSLKAARGAFTRAIEGGHLPHHTTATSPRYDNRRWRKGA